MESIIKDIFSKNWQAKVIAIVMAIIIWIFVNQSLISTKTIPNTPIRVINIPTEKTIIGLLPNNYLTHRITLTLSGSKDVIDNLERGDMEILLDASIAESDDWVVKITKKNIISLNPSLDLRHHLTHVAHPEFAIKFSQLITEKIPIIVKPPVGNVPQGYEYLGVWPERMTQILSGPREEIQDLKMKGLKFTLDMDKIAKSDLDNLKQLKKSNHDDEISFYIPDKWKQVPIPFRQNILQSINDPDARNLRIDFLRKSKILLEKNIPIYIYFPSKHLKEINPKNLTVAGNELIKNIYDIPFITEKLYVRDVSKLFLEVIKDNIEIVLIAAPKSEREILEWSLEIIDTQEMEDTYVAYFITEQKENLDRVSDPKDQDQILRKRFRNYLSKFHLTLENGERLNLKSTIVDDEIVVRIEE